MLGGKGFKELAHDHGGQVKTFNQARGLARHWAQMSSLKKQEGVCAGLVIAYLALNKTSGITKLNDQNELSVLRYAERLADYGADFSTGLGRFDTALSTVALQRRSAVISSPTPAAMAKSCIGSQSGRTFIKIKGHALGAVSAGLGAKTVFFDPNYGFARFPDSLKFVTFLGAFFNFGTYPTTVLQTIYIS